MFLVLQIQAIISIILYCLQGRQNNALLKDVHILILATYQYVSLHGKSYFEDVIKFTDLEVEKLFWIIFVDPI